MKTHYVQVVIGFANGSNPEVPNFGEATTFTESVHEALCQGIHEGNDAALDWLIAYCVNIKKVEKLVTINTDTDQGEGEGDNT